ncbi:CCHC-type domain-containing protein [Trichonephila clavipes]|nr:CCHC-type domain-containing protein [Trichonephila clavipes]
MGGINMPEDQKISHLMKGVTEDLYQELINSEVSLVDKFVTSCINDGPSDLEPIIREVRSNLIPLTREKPAPSPYRIERTGESSWRPRPRPRQENSPTQQDSRRKTDLWRTSDNVPICFHCGHSHSRNVQK